MKNLKKLLAAASLVVCGTANAALVFVGQWHVGDGPKWSDATQTAYSGQAAAALLFGGVASDYQISTISNLVADINNQAWMDRYGFGIQGTLAEDFSDGPLYTQGVHSAFILDNSCFNRYSDPNSPCTDQYINYAFRDDAQVPEPASLALFALGMFGLAASRRRKQA